ncbi:MAG: hypothetical protein ACPHGV_08385 [Synechococcus sp.]
MGLGHVDYGNQSGTDHGRNNTATLPLGGGKSWNSQDFRRLVNSVSRRDKGHVIDYNVHPDSTDYDTHEIHPGPDGYIYFTQQKHDRVGRISTDGRVEYFDMPVGSHPHGIRFDHDGRLYVSFEYLDQLVELDRINGAILNTYSVAFDDPDVEGVVGPHGFAVDQKNRLWYTGKSSDVIGMVDPATGEQEKYTLPTRANFTANFGHDIDSKASGPINVELDQDGNAWFVCLQTSQIGKVSTTGEVSEYTIEGLASDGNTRPINIFQGPDGAIWVTVEGDNTSTPDQPNQTNGGIARFDPDTESFIGYQQYRSKGAGGAVGENGSSVWFQYQEEALIQLEVNDQGRVYQSTFDLPDIGQRTMHRIAQGPDGNMWFTSLHQDTIGTITTDSTGLPVYGFKDNGVDSAYLSAYPQELTQFLQQRNRIAQQESLFLSSTKNAQSLATHRFSDSITGTTIWSIDRDEIKAMKRSDRYSFEGRDFRVYRELNDADGLVPIYEADLLSSDVRSWSTDADDFADANRFSSPEIAWFAKPFPLGDISS